MYTSGFRREISKCTPVNIEMYPRKVVALLKEQATFITARITLMWMMRIIQAQTIIDGGNKSVFM